jgi:hypothetical protein
MVMDAWETLVASALVGTNRQEPSIDLTHPALTDYAAQIQSQSATQQILSATGLLATYQAVGNTAAATTSTRLEPAPADDLRHCSPLTARHLSAILEDSKYWPILPELSQLLTQAKQTVPPEFLPRLLDLGKHDRQTHSLIMPILGSRSNWLSSQNPDWHYALGNDLNTADPERLPEIWQTGTRSERTIALKCWRKLDPAAARTAVAAIWKQEKADDRLIWLEVMRADLSLDDEEFLDIAMQDRSEKVRNFAIHLLSKLPKECKFRQQATALARQYLQLKVKGKSCFLDFEEPSKDDRNWQICDDKGKAVCMLTLAQMLSAADLQIWAEDIDRVIIAAIVSAANGNKGNTLIFYEGANSPILLGWIDAACNQKHSVWIKALLTHAKVFLNADRVQQLLHSLPTAEGDFRDRFFTQLLTASNFCETIDTTLDWLMGGDISSEDYYHRARLWDDQTSDLIANQYHKYIQQLDPSRTYYYQQQNQVNLIGRYLDVSVLPSLKQMQAKLTHDKFNYHNCIELLEFRQEMRSIFQS